MSRGGGSESLYFKAERGSKADFRILVRGLSARFAKWAGDIDFYTGKGLENPLFRQVPGEYRYYVTLLDKKRHRSYRYPEKGELSFTVTPSDRKGFLRVSARDPAYLEFSDGSPYLGIGHNLCGWEWGGTDNRLGTYEYDWWLSSMAQNGANLTQFDFCEGDQIEWTPCDNELPFSEDWKGLNEYNQQNAWKMDRRFQTAEELGIFSGFPCFIGRTLTTRRRNFLIGAGTEIPITIRTAVRQKTYPNFLKSQPARNM